MEANSALAGRFGASRQPETMAGAILAMKSLIRSVPALINVAKKRDGVCHYAWSVETRERPMLLQATHRAAFQPRRRRRVVGVADRRRGAFVRCKRLLGRRRPGRAYSVSGAMSAPFGQTTVPPSMK
jgi:hypothetical protein